MSMSALAFFFCADFHSICCSPVYEFVGEVLKSARFAVRVRHQGSWMCGGHGVILHDLLQKQLNTMGGSNSVYTPLEDVLL